MYLRAVGLQRVVCGHSWQAMSRKWGYPAAEERAGPSTRFDAHEQMPVPLGAGAERSGNCQNIVSVRYRCHYPLQDKPGRGLHIVLVAGGQNHRLLHEKAGRHSCRKGSQSGREDLLTGCSPAYSPLAGLARGGGGFPPLDLVWEETAPDGSAWASPRRAIFITMPSAASVITRLEPP